MRFNQLLLTVLVLFGAHAPAIAAPNAVPTSAAVKDEAAKQIQRRGSLYRVTQGERVGYLFGTIHVGTADFFPLEPQVTGALALATRLVVELDIRDSAPFHVALAKHGLYPANDTIANHISRDTYVLLETALRSAGVAMNEVSRYKPWLIGNLLMGMELDQNGFKRSHGIEYFLLAAAHDQAKVVDELESADYQLSLFDTMSDAEQEQYLRESMADLKDGKSLRKSRALIDGWSRADATTIAAVMTELSDGDSVSSTFMRQTLLGKRNPEMASRIEGIMKQNKVTFVGVGLLHLLGANGLPELLTQRGYAVEKIY